MLGVGGNTIDQAQQNLSYEEVQRWAAYRKKRGSLNVGMRIEYGTAMLAKLFIDFHRKKGANPVPIHELMPHEEEPEITLEDAMKNWH